MVSYFICQGNFDIYIPLMTPLHPDYRIAAFCNGMLWIDENGFCRIRHIGTNTQNMGAPEIEDMGRATREMCEGCKRKTILDLRGVKYTLAPGGRENIRSNEDLNNCRTAVAAIVDCPEVRVVVEKLIGIDKPPYPYQIFESEKEAVAWLKSL